MFQHFLIYTCTYFFNVASENQMEATGKKVKQHESETVVSKVSTEGQELPGGGSDKSEKEANSLEKTTEDPGSNLSYQPEEVEKEDVPKITSTDSTIAVPTSTVDSVTSTTGKLW